MHSSMLNDMPIGKQALHFHLWVMASALVGFTPRNDFKRMATRVSRQFYPKSRLINRHAQAWRQRCLNEELGVTDESCILYSTPPAFNPFSTLTITASNRFTYLFFPFDPTRTGGEPLESGTEYRNNTVGFRHIGNPRNVFFLSARVKLENTCRQYQTFSGTMNWRMGLFGQYFHEFQL